MKNYFTCFAFVVLAVLLSACGGRGDGSSAPAPEDDDITEMYQLYISGNYKEYVENVLSCVDKPEDYRQQMAALYAQNARKNGDVKAVDFSVEKVEQFNGYANAYLRIQYSDKSSEVILLPLVYKDDRWWVK